MNTNNMWQKDVLRTGQDGGSAGCLLIEDAQGFVSLHQLCMYAYILAQGKRLNTLFLFDKDSRAAEMASKYFPNAAFVQRDLIFFLTELRIFCFACFTWLRLLFTQNLIDLRWSGKYIGDIVYDQYLAVQQRATVRYFDVRLPILIFQIVRALQRNLKTMARVKPAALLVSHRVGFSGATLAAAAESLGVPIFSFGGGRYGTLFHSKIRKEYEYSADRENLEPLLAMGPRETERQFELVAKQLLGGLFNADAQLAYSKQIFTDRSVFANTFNLDGTRKNIFVMLHAFTDYPHSHFNGMLFRDYFDWFIKTLEHAYSNSSVNWIIKEHPASHFYPVRDLDWNAIKARFSAPHIVFMSPQSPFNSMSIRYVGDAVLTCQGSAGFELSALGGIPSITAGENPYFRAGFATYPKSVDEYFSVLSSLATISKLSTEKHLIAKAAFVFIHRLSRVEMSSIPNLSHGDNRKLQSDTSYFGLVQNQIQEHQEDVIRQLDRYIELVKRPDFKALRTHPSELEAD